jgi:uncharacterized protein YbaP (TraB family)
MKRLVVLVTFAAVAATACKKPADSRAPAPAEPTTVATAPARAPENLNAPAPAQALAHPLLWSAEKAGHTTYLFGTMHAGIDAEARLPPVIWRTLDAARVFAMEADLDDPAAASAIRPTAGSLRQDLGDAYWQKLEAAMGPQMASAIEHLPAMVPAAALSMRGLPQTPPMDKVLAARATRARKPVVFLEPASRQLSILARWMDVKALKMMLDELPEAERRAHAMLDAYTEGDERKLLAISDAEKADALGHGYTAREYDQEMAELLYNRNASWIDAIEKLHAEGGGFIAVGALHLVGPRSVLELLAQDGYSVTRVAP